MKALLIACFAIHWISHVVRVSYNTYYKEKAQHFKTQ